MVMPHPPSSPSLLDSDGDSIPDSEDEDDDGDGVPDAEDDFPLDPGASVSYDGDGDGVPDVNDAFPLDPAESNDNDADGHVLTAHHRRRH